MNLQVDLHDIDGLDAISFWPLSMSAWILIAVTVFALAVLVFFTVRKIIFKRSWKNDTLLRLASLEKDLSDETARETAIALSEYLRRIALKRFPRKECAGLVGDAWLKWLAKHDPKSFEWETKGTLLIEVPYAPIHMQLSTDRIKDLIQAIRNWVH